ncbi:cyanophycinase [Candidatus Cyanaurora vandensis]|uniref:cyanophycinase n=1 Tax=Candidatus Cyanaurora vandensis TaxID=2714958 RepID=UPI00257A9B8F|nr:cyanophycinase [Candidatus Cyanaurora vandensis]
MPEGSNLTMPIQPPVNVIIIGGAEDKENDKLILAKVFQAAGGLKARILIVPTASAEPELLGAVYEQLFIEMGAQSVVVLDLTTRAQADLPEMEWRLKQATCVFLTGGDQVRLTTILAHTRFSRVLRQLWEEHRLLIAGTSAGASALGSCMIAWGTSGESPSRSIVELATGMGLLPSLIIDQHFFNRNRLARLIAAVAAHPTYLGMGIDENTAVLLGAEGLFEVVGEGAVTIGWQSPHLQ